MFNKRQLKRSLKKLLSYVAYIFTGVIACFFAFLLVVNFLTSGFAVENKPSQKQKYSFKKLFEGVKEVFVGLKSKKEEVKEDLNSFKNLNETNKKETPFQEQEFQGLDQPDNFPSEANLEAQSYMAPFIYESVNQRDPFDDPTLRNVIKGSIKQIKSVTDIPKTPPEGYELDEIQLRGIIWDTKVPKVLFELPNNEGYYTLIKGDKVGHSGIIFEIRESEVVVVETSYIGTGKDITEEKRIKIKKINRLSE